MGTVRKIGNEYYIEFEARGLKYHQKAGFNEKAAWMMLQQVEDKIKSGQMGAMVRDVETDVFLTDFLEFAAAEHTPATFHRLKITIQHFRGFLLGQKKMGEKLSGMTPSVIESYKRYLIQNQMIRSGKKSRKILNLTLILIWEVFEYAIKQGYLNDNPALHIKFLRDSKNYLPRILSSAEQEMLLSNSPPEWALNLEFLILSGLRLKEFLSLEWGHYDEASQAIQVKSTQGHEACRYSTRTIPLSARMKELLSKQKKTKKENTVFVFADHGNVKSEFHKFVNEFAGLRKSLGLPDEIQSAAFRHTFACNQIRRGVRFGKLYRFLGLSDIAKAMVYFPCLPELNAKDLFH